MQHFNFHALIAFAICCGTPWASGDEPRREPPRSRTFQLEYGVTLTRLPKAATLRVWLPVPESNAHQVITPLASRLPAPAVVNKEERYGNKILSLETVSPPDGILAFSVAYRVTRSEVQGLAKSTGSSLTVEQRRRFLAANRNVPIIGRPLELLQGVSLPADALARGRAIYDRVDEHVRYDKSQAGYGNGDVLWVCDSRRGNCTDFHSLFISLARAHHIPARFEIGFPLPPQRGVGAIGGYHCWAHFYVAGQGWVPVDISEADKHPELRDYYFGNLTENRVAFSVGRDLELVPQQASPPLNYFIYPHVEVDGEQLPQQQVQLTLTYVDQ